MLEVYLYQKVIEYILTSTRDRLLSIITVPSRVAIIEYYSMVAIDFHRRLLKRVLVFFFQPKVEHGY